MTAHIDYQGRAQYDDELKMTTTARMDGRAKMRFDVEIVQLETAALVCRGHTIHAITDRSGRPIRPPKWLLALMENPGGPAP